ncbi:MAG: class III extradiol dioxygenase subunit B-like domain-containing protein [Patescibacteria group bacterium]|jgi:aromatic ring-opening dioxygenase LigB subunit
MIVFAGIVPCSPLLLPSINPEHIHKIEKTREALKNLSEELFAAKPDTIVIFCEHTNTPDDAFTINVSDPYHAGLTQFGDLGYNKTYGTDFMLADGAQRNIRHTGYSVTLETEKELPFTATIPLSFLTEHLPNVRILPIAPSKKTPKEHFDFGTALRESLLNSPKRIAVIAAGDGSHTRSTEAPGGFHEDGKKLDELLSTLIKQKNTAGLLQINPEMLKNAQDALYRQVLMLFGVLESMPVTCEILSEEAPFGVGELVAELRF